MAVLNYLVLLLMVLVPRQVIADTYSEIDEQIWQPFALHFSRFNTKAFNELHTQDTLRGHPTELKRGQQYFDSNAAFWRQLRKKEATQSIEFAFEQRVHNADTAYEIGYYCVIATEDDQSKKFFGQFHVVLRKLDGHWKIAQDWDSPEVLGQKITEEDFLKFRNANSSSEGS